MTPTERETAVALGRVTMVPGIPAKRFARSMAHQAEMYPNQPLTADQRKYLAILAWRYRRQLPSHLRPGMKPEGA